MCTRNSPALSLTCERNKGGRRSGERRGRRRRMEACSVRRSGMILKKHCPHTATIVHLRRCERQEGKTEWRSQAEGVIKNGREFCKKLRYKKSGHPEELWDLTLSQKWPKVLYFYVHTQFTFPSTSQTHSSPSPRPPARQKSMYLIFIAKRRHLILA